MKITKQNCYKVIAVDLSRQKEINADPKPNQQREIAGKILKTRRQ